MKDPELEAYVEAIEAHLGSLRVGTHTLSPRDFGTARGWYESGVPLAAALAAVDRRAESGPVNSLAQVMPGAESGVAGAEARRPREEPRPATALGGAYPEVQERLHRLLETLRGRDDASAPQRRVEQLVDLLSVSTRPNADHVRRQLEEIDAAVAELALRWAPAARVAEWRDEAARALERQRGRVSDAALEQSLRRHVETRAREELDLPKVAIL